MCATEDRVDSRYIQSAWESFARRFLQSRLARYVNVTMLVRRDGCPRRVPLIGGVGIDNLSPGEPWMSRILPQLLRRRPGAFVDVGVNVGQTLLKLKAIDPACPYIGFEPNPACFCYTQRLISDNGFVNCTVIPVGLSNRATVVPFFLDDEVDVGGSSIEGFRKPNQYSHVRHVAVFPGDTVLATLDRPTVGVLKVDVEGAELEVLEGLRETLDSRPFVLCEILPVFTRDGVKGRFRKPRQDKLLAVMRAARYALYRVLPDASVVPMDDIEIHGDPSLSNYLFAPDEQRAFVEGAFRRGTPKSQP
jgi:FkbM family methyltransferase